MQFIFKNVLNNNKKGSILKTLKNNFLGEFEITIY